MCSIFRKNRHLGAKVTIERQETVLFSCDSPSCAEQAETPESWVVLGVANPQNETETLALSDKHFCSTTCMISYLESL